MNKNWRRLAHSVLFLVFLSLPATLLADDHKTMAKSGMESPPPTLVEMWMVWPKAGEHEAFEAKLKEFVAWRKANGDPLTWTVWTPAMGTDLDSYAIRSQEIHWKDLDAARDWGRKTKAGEKYREMLAPHVHKVSRYFDEFDPELSHWKYEGEPRYVGVSVVDVLPGKWAGVKSSLETFRKAAEEHGWSESWAVMYNIGGKGGIAFAWPFADYADMAEPEVKASALLEKALGSKEKAGEVMKAYGSSTKTRDYTIWAYRPDLSTPKD
ncbi:hypothetical protein [Pseudomarimonas salicorniae]|uniref:NIPSNAP protein n=1 Tax=Pseudomarimonas salicorniae TaxID=2933270 RepID=A0ABT0GD80_9GAMM|nr:hypothetical protein [Lysobacter sp. CAU 1642]MCK7592506.1 hypothetical protein [Lysobacter sp. CAU 1642]